MQDGFQIWEPKRSQLLAQLARHKARERRVFLFDTCLLLAKQTSEKCERERERGERSSDRSERPESAKEMTQQVAAVRTRYILKDKIFVCPISHSFTAFTHLEPFSLSLLSLI